MLIVDSIAARYGKLPSEVIASATNYDLQVIDLRMQHNTKSEAGNKKGNTQIDRSKVDEMMANAARIKKELMEDAARTK